MIERDIGITGREFDMDAKCDARLVARFSEADDVREVFVGGDGAGGLSVREEVSGPSARLVYDEDRHVSRISLGEAALQRLAEERRWEGDVRGCVEEWLTEKDHALIDLMDICDAAGVEYVYATLGKDSVLQFRPSGL
jgi:hypothetical protein